ncbi:tetratricopeptide repeat protein [Tenacibaculum caenipelagi]|uniref:Regulatory LuxR family protein n=1 Tax=Tenacibaculum caenipelagi TaxID=1325435 RepID=A0A4R6TF19_9FLAO|nr:tetratricopeptide repeat protein [Tenacibaculum caenipelagi]TDQ28383.1 regulatory LuxR family protein [Tenacibaculum caenipelagi]
MLKLSNCVYKLVIILLTISSSVVAQSKDSTLYELKSNIKESSSDSIRIHSKIELTKYILNRDIDTARILINEVIKVLEASKYNNVYFTGKKAEAINYLAIIEAKQSFPEKALSNYLKALEISKNIKDSTMLGLTLHNLGMFYRRQKEYDKAKTYFKEAIEIRERTHGNYDDLATSYNMLGVTYFYEKQYDSAFIKYSKAKELFTSKQGIAKVNGNLALLYYSSKQYDKAIKTFQENIKIFKELGLLNELSTAYLNLAASYNGIKNYKESILRLDSAITISKRIKHKELLRKQYYSRSSVYKTTGNFEHALKDYTLYKAYNDSLNDTEKAKRITALELNYQFEKEKLQTELKLQNEKAKKQWYFGLLMLSVASAITIFLLIRKNTKNRLALSTRKLENEQLQRKTAEQVLQLKEAELKNEHLNNQIKQEYQELFIKELKSILSIESGEDKTKAIKSLLASLKSKNIDYNTSLSLAEYLDKVSPSFKIKLNTHFSFLNEKEKKLLYLMKLGLSTNEIKDLQSISLASVKSTRYRIRKKLEINSDEDIINYIENYIPKE